MKEVYLNKLTNKEKGYLFGLFEGDGYKYYHPKTNHYSVEFYLNSVKDKKIIKFICSLLKKIELTPFFMKDKRFNCMRIRVNSKGLFIAINKNITLKDKNKEFKMGFISGLIDSEGYCNKIKSHLEIVNTNKKILEECKEFLDSLKISSKLRKRIFSKKDKKESYRILISVKFKRLNHLSIKAGKLSWHSGVETNVALKSQHVT